MPKIKKPAKKKKIVIPSKPMTDAERIKELVRIIEEFKKKETEIKNKFISKAKPGTCKRYIDGYKYTFRAKQS